MARFDRQSMMEDYQQVQVVSPAKEASEPNFVFELRSFKFLNQENGFFIAQGKTNSPASDVPAMWRSRFNKDNVAIKGTALALASHDFVGTTIECFGDWVMDPKFGLQYQFQWAREAMPSTIEALEKYLSHGRIKGIGPATAQAIVKKWGMNTLDVLSNSPEDLLAIQGITPAKLEGIKKDWNMKKSAYQLTSFFGLYGIGEVWVARIIEKMGLENLESRVRANPYALTQVDGIGFSTADKMALALGFAAHSTMRCEAMLLHLLTEYTERQGHTARPVEEWVREAASQLQITPQSIQGIGQDLINRRLVVLRNLPFDVTGCNDPDRMTMVPCVSPRKDFSAERSIANNLVRIKNTAKKLTSSQETLLFSMIGEKSSTLDASQVEGALGVIQNSLSVLTGGPGTGKTTTLKSIIDVAEALGWRVILAAPTGRAAKRMEEAIGRSASTIHRCLKYNPKEGFTHNVNNPIQGDFFVVDEASMIDNAIGASFLSAIPADAHVLFVGDIDQLPSVGAGNFLKDIITSQICPVHRLTRVHRQAKGSLIADAAQKIISGRMPELDGDEWTDDFAWISPPAGLTNSEINDFIFDNIKQLVEQYVKNGIPRSSIQVLSPQREGLVGVNGLNDGLRWLLNENGKPHSNEECEQPMVVGDRLLVTKNNYDKDIFNGDMGVVQEVDYESGEMKLKMEDGRTVELERLDRKYLTLGYAITVHKSQGGERPVIIMPCSPSHDFSMNKNLIYTGITRGKEKVVVVGSPKTLHNALRKEEKTYRLTGLVDEIHRLCPSPSLTKRVGGFNP